MKFYPIVAVVRNPNGGDYDRFKSAHTKITALIEGVPTDIRIVDTNTSEAIAVTGYVAIKGAALFYIRHPDDPINTALKYVVSGRVRTFKKAQV